GGQGCRRSRERGRASNQLLQNGKSTPAAETTQEQVGRSSEAGEGGLPRIYFDRALRRRYTRATSIAKEHTMTRRLCLLALLALCVIPITARADEKPKKRPNILFIM